MSVRIEMMTEKEFQAFRHQSIEQQAKELMEEQHLSEEDACRTAMREFSAMLPDGLNTVFHQLMTIVETDTEETVGYIWTLHEETDGRMQCFICDFAIRESRRRKGYGMMALQLAEKLAAEAGCRESVLYVGDHNGAANALYQKCGYRILRQKNYGKYMIKQLR